jgi:O-antigen/teichoic acid export membrane protein
VRTTGMYLAVRHPLRPSLDRRAGRDLLGFGFGHSLAQIGTVVSQQGDNLVVGRWMGPAALGVYGRAYKLMVNPASAFGRIVNRVLFPVMAQVQDAPKRLANAYERTSAVVALISLPLSSFLWVVAPEFIPVILGPRWGAVVLPFRMFSISLLFRMSSKISDACTKAAGQVYSRALIQWTYAALVVTAAIIGQRWGLGAVAVGVSIAMCINWLMMAQLARSVTGLSWIRFARAHLPGAALAVVIGLAVALAVHPARSAHLGSIPILIVAAITASGVLVAASLLHAELFLGEHATWAFQHVNQFIRRRSQRLRHPAAVSESLASARQDSQ